LQPYTREEYLAEQIAAKLKDIVIDQPTYDYLMSELKNRKDKEENFASDTRTELKADLKNIETTLNKLLDGYLEGVIDKEDYRLKKEQLLNKKADIKANLGKIRRNPDFRFELAKDLFSACFSVNKIILERNLPALSDFLKKSGLNHILKEKTLFFSWAIPYSHVAEGNRKINFLMNKYRRHYSDFQDLGQLDCSLVEMAGNCQPEAPAELLSGVRRVWSG